MKPIGRNATNLQVSKLLRCVAAALTLEGDNNRFRVIAYEKAADAIEHATSEVKDLWEENNLGQQAGVGPSIAQHLDELFKTGKVKHFDEILKPYPEAIFELMDIPGIGPKNAYKLTKSLGLSKAQNAVTKLEKAAKSGEIAKIESFGEESQANILKNIEVYRGRTRRLLVDAAHAIVGGVIDWMQKNPYVKQIDYLGSLRRQASTIGDLDLSVATTHPKEVLEHFTKYPKAGRVLEKGEHSSSILVPGDIQVDLMVQPPDAYGSLLQHFTGSKHHNVALREYALKQGLSLSEYGIRKISKSTRPDSDENLIKFSNEKDFYNHLGLDYVPPELREGRGEIEAAKNHNLPQLVEVKDIKGDLQIHSNIDIETSHDLGSSSLSQLAEQAKKLGYEYIGVTEHNPAVTGHTKDQIIDLVKRKTEEVRSFSGPVHIFNGLEIDSQPDGKRALPDEALELLDYACVSIHSSFNQDRKAATDRVLRALDHPKVKFLAHPTGRLLNEREGVDFDWDRLFDFCLKNDKWLEIDGWPNRLDLPDALVHEAVKKGVKLIIDTDAHDHSGLIYMPYGVSVARRGWATPADIINTCSLAQMKKLFL